VGSSLSLNVETGRDDVALTYRAGSSPPL